jgi:hypothetical protein
MPFYSFLYNNFIVKNIKDGLKSSLDLNKPEWEKWIKEAKKDEPKILKKNTYETELWIGLSIFVKRLCAFAIIMILNANIIYIMKEMPEEDCGAFLLNKWFPTDCDSPPYGNNSPTVIKNKFGFDENVCFSGIDKEEAIDIAKRIFKQEFPDGGEGIALTPEQEEFREFAESGEYPNKMEKKTAYFKELKKQQQDKCGKEMGEGWMYNLLYNIGGTTWQRFPYKAFTYEVPGTTETSPQEQSTFTRIVSWFLSCLAITNVKLDLHIKELIRSPYIKWIPQWVFILFGYTLYLLIAGLTTIYTSYSLIWQQYKQMSKFQGTSDPAAASDGSIFEWWIGMFIIFIPLVFLNIGIVGYNNINVMFKFALYPLLFHGFKTFSVIFENPGLIAFMVGLIFISALHETPLDESYSLNAKRIPTGIFIVCSILQLLRWLKNNSSEIKTKISGEFHGPPAEVPGGIKLTGARPSE